MKTENWREEFDNQFDRLSGYSFGNKWMYREDISDEIKDFIHQELARQKKEIIKIVSSYSGDMCYASQNIINKIKEM